ncbi:hypothetical protein PRUPE_1G329800 [Prunus persica]|uniref:Uncharacterized protein n=1 Tax=Prunus persica TaxID=3760 RepID=A0A251R718_PRUPE|nr:hypothetical protein PRUPE_1G329800 [Prunus persica]
MASSSSIIFFISNFSATTSTTPPKINPSLPPKIQSFTVVFRSRTWPPLPTSNFISPTLFLPIGWYICIFRTLFANQEENQINYT